MAGRLLPGPVMHRLTPHLARIDSLLDPANADAAPQRKALYTFAIRVLGALFAYIFQIALARWMGSHEFGIFVVVWTWITLLSSLVSLGFDTSVIRLIPEYDHAGDTASLRGILAGSRIISLASSTLIVALAIAGVWLFSDHVTNHYVMPLYLGFACLPLLALMNVQDGIARAFDWFDIALIPTYIYRPLAILLIVASVGLVVHERSAEWALTAAIGGTYLVALIQTVALHFRLGGVVERGPRTYTFARWIAISLPILLIDGFFILLTSSDILIASYFVDPNEVAVYHVAVKTLAIAHFVYYALRAVSAHRFSRLYHSGDMRGLADYAGQAVRWCFWPTVLICMLLLAAGPFLLLLFGPQYTSGYPLLFILAIGIVARASIGPAESLLTMSGHQMLCAAAYGSTFAMNAALNVVLIWQLGLVGAAIATSASLVAESIIIYAMVQRTLGIHAFVFAVGPKRAR